MSDSIFKPHNLKANQVATPESIALYDAAKQADLSKVNAQLAAGGNPNWYNNPQGGATSLHMAAKADGPNAAKVVQTLLKNGAVVDVLTLPEFNTPLHLASAKGNLDVVKLLVEEGGNDINRANSFGNTALHEATITGNEAITRVLLDKGAEVNATNKRGSTPLLFACYGDNVTPSLINLLLQHGADQTMCDEDGMGVLHICAVKGHGDILSLFLSRGMDPTQLDASGNAPSFYAKISTNKNPAVLKLLHVDENNA